MMPCIWCIIFGGLVINTTAYHLGKYSLHLVLLKSSIANEMSEECSLNYFCIPSFLNNFQSPNVAKNSPECPFTMSNLVNAIRSQKTTLHVQFCSQFSTLINMTRLGNLLDFGQLFKAFGNN